MRKNIWSISLAVIFLTSCGGQHAPAPSTQAQNENSSGQDSNRPASLEPTFQSIKTNIFQPKCMSCHASGGTASDVRLDPRETLLNSPRELVIPGTPDESGLIIAITRSGVQRMPPPSTGATALSQDEISIIRQWIQEGATE